MKLFGNTKKPQPAVSAAENEIDTTEPMVGTGLPDGPLGTDGQFDTEKSGPSPEPEDALPTTEELMRAAEAAVDAPIEEALPEEAPAEPAEAAKSGKKRGWLIALGAAVAAIVLVVAVILGTAMYVKDYDGVYPRVTVADEAFGELSLQEAEELLSRKVLPEAEDVAITVEMPGSALELTYGDIGLDMTPAEAAQLVYGYGRDGGALDNTIKFLGCMIAGKDLTDAVFGAPDEGVLTAKIRQAVADAKAALAADVEIDPEAQTLTVIKGAARIQLKEDEILELVLHAARQRAYGTLTYEPLISESTEDEIALLREQYCAEPVDAYYDKEAEAVVAEVIGIDFDDEAVRKQWLAAAEGEAVTLDVTVTVPEMTGEHLEEVLFSKVLAESETTIKWSNANRKNNIALACKAIDGIVLLPGETFSYNDALGERTKERGYKLAGAYAGGQTVSEYGGGICQGSSALYYCALLSNLQIDERTNHTFRVGYLPISYDATVSWGGPEFKFTNNRDYPIRIKAYTTDESLFVSIEGTDDGTYVKLSYNCWKAYTDKEYPDVATGLYAYATRKVYDSETNELLETIKEKTGLYKYHEEDIEYPEDQEETSPEPSAEPGNTPEPGATPVPEVTVTPGTTDTPVTTPAPTTAPTPTPVPEVTPTPAPEATPQPQPTPAPEASGGEGETA